MIFIYFQLLNKKDKGSDSPEPDDEYVLTPHTVENYKRIDAEYARVMQAPVNYYFIHLFFAVVNILINLPEFL